MYPSANGNKDTFPASWGVVGHNIADFAEGRGCIAPGVEGSFIGLRKWPSREEREVYAQMVQLKYPAITGRFGLVDGKNFRVQEPADTDFQNAMYNGCSYNWLVNMEQI